MFTHTIGEYPSYEFLYTYIIWDSISIGNPPKGYNVRLENLVSPKVSTRLAALFSKVVMGPAQKYEHRKLMISFRMCKQRVLNLCYKNGNFLLTRPVLAENYVT